MRSSACAAHHLTVPGVQRRPGCSNTGAIHAGTPTYDSDKRAHIAVVAAVLSDRDGDQRTRAIERLALLDARSHANAIEAHLVDDDWQVRRAAATALARIGGSSHVAPLTAAYRKETNADVKIATISLVIK